MPIIVSTESSAVTERHVIGTFTAGGRFTPLLDVNDGSAIRVREFRVTPYEESPIYPAATRRYGGSRQAGEIHGNGSLEVAWILRDETADEVLGQWDALAALLESSRADLYYMWRPGAASQPSYFQLRGGLSPAWDYVWWQFNQRILQLSAGFQVAPLAYGDPMDILDSFDTDTLSEDYTFDTGSGTLSVSGGQLVPSSTATKRLYHSARGYTYTDLQVTLKYTAGTTPASSTTGVLVKRLSASSYLAVDVSGATMRIQKNDATVLTSFGVTALTPGNTYWLVGRIERNVVTAEHWTSEPAPGGTPAVTINYTLSGSDAGTFGQAVAGQAGLRATPAVTDWRYDEFRVEPYTFAVGASPTKAAHDFTLYGVPGTAPAEAALESSFTSQVGGIIAGWGVKDVEQYVANGHFESVSVGRETAGWATAAVAGVTGAATSITRVTTASKYGAASGEVVCPATSGTGVNFPMYRRFKKGVTYTAVGWMQSAAHTTAVKLRLGVSGDQADSTAVALTTSFVQHTATWTPTADRDVAYVAAIINAATATTFRLDGVMVYEGTTAPTTGFLSQGFGAVAPLGLLEFEGAYQEASAGVMALTADATASGGYAMKRTGAANSEAWWFYWRLDPTLLEPDEFSSSLTVEFWLRYKQTSTAYDPQFQIRAWTLFDPAGTGGDFIESDVGARSVNTDSANWFVTRAGALVFPIDPATNAPWEIQFVVTLPSSGVTGDLSLDCLHAVPARQRVAGGLGSAALSASTTNPTVLRLASDLSALTKRYPGPQGRRSASPGGQRIELPPGTCHVSHRLTLDVLRDAGGDGTISAPTGQVVHFDIWPRYHITRST